VERRLSGSEIPSGPLRVRVLHSRGPGPTRGPRGAQWAPGIMNETARSRFDVRGPGMREREVPRGPPDSMEPREKFVWSFFERHNKNASVPPPSPPPSPPSTRQGPPPPSSLLGCVLRVQVAASQAVTHPAGFLRIEKGVVTMGDARALRRGTMTGRRPVEDDSHGYLCDIIRRGDTGPGRPVNNATLPEEAECLVPRQLSMDVNDRAYLS